MNEWIEFSGKTVEEAKNAAAKQFNKSIEELEIEIIEKESKGLLGMFAKPALIKVKNNLSAVEIVEDFLKNVFESMEIEAQIEIDYNEEEQTMNINLTGEDMGILIGKRGQTLDSLQYLTSLVVNKENKSYIKVKVDTENYRERRKETLENLAKNISFKVKRTRRQVVLEPMNPYERRIIHSALQNDKFVETHSEGEEPFRKVVITPKKGLKDYNDNRRGGYYKNNRYSNNTAKDYKKKFNDNYKKSYQSITFDDIEEKKEEDNQ